MKVVSGKYKGKKLLGPKKSKTRPVSNYVKERLFDILRDCVDAKLVLDLYAGTGAIGIEALSRGSKHVTFVERNYSACNIIKMNLSGIADEKNTKVIKEDVGKFVKRTKDVYDLIFSAPPYTKEYYIDFMEKIDSSPFILESDGKMIIESNKHCVEQIELENFVKVRNIKCDDTILEIWIHKQNEETR